MATQYGSSSEAVNDLPVLQVLFFVTLASLFGAAALLLSSHPDEPCFRSHTVRLAVVRRRPALAVPPEPWLCGVVQPYRGGWVDGYYRAVPLRWSVRLSALVRPSPCGGGGREREGEVAWGDMYPHPATAPAFRARLWARGTCFGLCGGRGRLMERDTRGTVRTGLLTSFCLIWAVAVYLISLMHWYDLTWAS